MVSGVEFDEDKIDYGGPRAIRRPSSTAGGPAPAYNVAQYNARGSGMAGWLVSHGWAKSETAAQIILIVIVLINIVITYVVVKFFLL